MSWQSYVDDQLVATGHISRGAILGLDGSTWAISPSLTIKPEELSHLLGGLADNNKFMASGIKLNGDKFMFLRADDRSVYGKKGAAGVAIVKTNSAIIIGIYDEGIQPAKPP
eukprot:TRINITY_DN150_c0_g1_i1.p2 TRINITY_DN150_c0_g1~~TRINITY_DN150_c0_g1_i1.p2  ORF type:complete len:112 (+),score=58.24 TRINITY_DN150_c0_g1_i1:89-424(+)